MDNLYLSSNNPVTKIVIHKKANNMSKLPKATFKFIKIKLKKY